MKTEHNPSPLNDTLTEEVSSLFNECSLLFDTGCSRLQKLVSELEGRVPTHEVEAFQKALGDLEQSAYPYDALQAVLLNRDNDPRHRWECTSPGMYDFTYTCERCGQKHTESIDNPGSEPPVYGCSGRPSESNADNAAGGSST